MKMISMKRNEEESGDDEKVLKIWDCGSPLYDAYELVAVSHVVERHLMVLPHLSGSRIQEASCCSQKKKALQLETTTSSGRSSAPSLLALFNRSVWKRKKIDGEIKHKPKKQKTGISNFFAWKK